MYAKRDSYQYWSHVRRLKIVPFPTLTLFVTNDTWVKCAQPLNQSITGMMYFIKVWDTHNPFTVYYICFEISFPTCNHKNSSLNNIHVLISIDLWSCRTTFVDAAKTCRILLFGRVITCSLTIPQTGSYVPGISLKLGWNVNATYLRLFTCINIIITWSFTLL